MVKLNPKKRLIWRCIIIFLPVLIIAVSGWLVLDDQSPINQRSALTAALDWARLTPLPNTATNLVITPKGSMFTREFIIEFTAPSVDVEKWLSKSSGTRGVKPTIQSNGRRVFNIKPGGGAQFAEVIVSSAGTTVKIHTYWS